MHILHFAIARLDLDMLKYAASEIPLRNARVTALGHTLLHVACMPADSLEVMRHSKEIYQNIHETRDLHPTNDPNIIEEGSTKFMMSRIIHDKLLTSNTFRSMESKI